MVKDLYIALKSQIELYLPELKGNTYLWNNQFNHSNGTGAAGRDEAAFNYPVVFLEFNEFKFRQLSLGVQEFDFLLKTHLGFKSFLKEDITLLDLQERLYWVCQRFQQGSFARLSRIDEAWDTNRTDIGITVTTYQGYGKDFNRFVFAEASLTGLTGLSIGASFSAGLTGSVNYGGTGGDTNGNNEYQP